MMNLNEIKITPRDDQVLRLLVQGCSNKEIAVHLNISPRTVKQHLRTLFLRAGIRDGRKRVKLATAMYAKELAGTPVKAYATPCSGNMWCIERMTVQRSITCAVLGSSSQTSIPGTLVLIGLKSPRYSAGASGFMS